MLMDKRPILGHCFITNDRKSIDKIIIENSLVQKDIGEGYMGKYYEPTFNIYHASMDPDAGGIQNTAYCFLKELNKKYKIKGLSAKLPAEYRMDCLAEVEKYTLVRAVSWIVKNSNRTTWNIVMNCWMGIPALVAKILKGSHYFVLAHGNDVYDIAYPKKGIKQQIFRGINSTILKTADFVVCNSNYTLGLIQNLNLKHTYIISPPCDFYGHAEDALLNPFMIFSIGRLVERKGFQFVIDAVELLRKEFPAIQYFIAGAGGYAGELEQRIRELKLEKHVFLLGKVDRETKIRYMRQCGIFAMPSIELAESSSVEGFGIVFIEANQFGKYVIGSASGGIPDAICQNITGCILEKVTGDAVADQIREVLTDFDLYYSNDAVEKRKKWAEKYYVENIVENYLRIIKQFVQC